MSLSTTCTLPYVHHLRTPRLVFCGLHYELHYGCMETHLTFTDPDTGTELDTYERRHNFRLYTQLMDFRLSHGPTCMTQPPFVHKSKKVLDKSNMYTRYLATSLQFLEARGLHRTRFVPVMANKKYLQQRLCTLIDYCKSQIFFYGEAEL